MEWYEIKGPPLNIGKVKGLIRHQRGFTRLNGGVLYVSIGKSHTVWLERIALDFGCEILHLEARPAFITRGPSKAQREAA